MLVVERLITKRQQNGHNGEKLREDKENMLEQEKGDQKIEQHADRQLEEKGNMRNNVN